MKKVWMNLTAIGIGAMGMMAVVSRAAEVKLPIDQVPPAVKATILAEQGEIEDIARKTSKSGKVIYEADIVVKGQLIELQVTEDGKVASRKIEGDVIPTTKSAAKNPEAVAEAKLCQAGADNLAKAKITLGQAIATARKHSDGAKPIKAELKKSGEKRLFKITLLDSDKTKAVNVDAVSGAVVKGGGVEDKSAADESDKSAKREGQAKPEAEVVGALPRAKVTLVEAIETAVARNPESKAFFAEFKPEKSKPRYEILVVTGDKGFEVVIDGITRKVVEVETKADKLGKPTKEFRTSWKVSKASWTSTGKNPYFSLEPGTVSVFQDGKVKLTITVTDKTKMVDGVETRVVEEREEENGKPIEISQNYFAISKKSGNVYYFGEAVDEYDGDEVTHGGEWLAGVNGAKFGLLMPAEPKVGHKFYQEQAPGVAMDRAEVISMDKEVTTPAGTFNCVYVRETSAIEKGVSHKYYAPGIGLVKDDGAVLVQAPTVK